MPEIPFSDFGVKWFEDIVQKVTKWFVGEITSTLRQLTNSFFGTPLPDGSGRSLVFGAPSQSDEPWHSIYEAVVAGEVMVFALLILFLAVQGRHFIRIFNFSSAYDERRTRRSSWTGAVLIVGWYWVALLLLYLVDGLTIALIPDVSTLGASLVQLLPAAAGNPGLTLVMAMLGGLAMVALKAVFFIREVLLFVYLYGVPFGLAFTFANIPIVSRVANRICLQFVPLALLPVPAAVLFRGYELLFAGEQFVSLATPFLQYLVVISLPLLALFVTWKTFRYASPLTARVIGGTTRAAATLGAVAGAGSVAGPYAATTAARWGPKAGLAQAATQQAFGQPRGDSSVGGTKRDNLADDGGGNGGGGGGVPQYRRSENDPGYY